MATIADSTIEAAPPLQSQTPSASTPQSPTAASSTASATLADKGQSRDSCIANEFVGGVPEDLVCKGCLRVPRRPLVTQCCSQVFSLACLQGNSKEFACEQDGEPKGRANSKKEKKGATLPLNMVVVRAKPRTMCCLSEKELAYEIDEERQRRVDLLVVKCLNRGCSWSGTVADLFNNHSTICESAQVHCSECAAVVKRGRLARHMREDCRYRSMRCPYCNVEGKYAEILGLDVALVNKHRCLKIMVSCPNRCRGSRKFERGALAQHLAVCPLQSVDCDFKSVGCQAKLSRKTLDQHRKNAQEEHLLLLLTAVQSRMTLLRDEIDFLTQNVGDPATGTSLACMRQHATMGRLCLDGIGDKVTFRIRNYGHLQQFAKDDGKWESPSFYFSSKYRMELIAHPGGRGVYVGRSLSISLCVNKPEDESKSSDSGWPIDCAFIALQVSVLPQVDHHSLPQAETNGEMLPKRKSVTAHVCHVCRERHKYKTLPENSDQLTAVVLDEEDFAQSHYLADAGLLFKDSIILQVELTSCECTYE